MSLLWVTVQHGIEDLRTRPRHPDYIRCLRWRATWDTRCARSPDTQMPSVDLRGIALPPDQNHGFRPPARTGRDYSRIKCFSCGEFGHMQSRCQRPDSSLPFKPPGWHLQSDNQPPRDGNNSQGNSPIDRDITHTGLYMLHSAPLSSSYITSTSTAQSKDIVIIHTHPQSKTCTETCASFMDRQDMESEEVFSQDAEEQRSSADMDQDTDRSHTTIRPVGRSVDWSVSVDNQQSDEDIKQISGDGSLVSGGLD